MKNQKGLFYGLTAIAMAALIIGLNQFSQAAQTENVSGKNFKAGNTQDGRGQGRMMAVGAEKSFLKKEMTEEDKAAFEAKRTEFAAEMKVKQGAIEAAINAGDYSAWVAAVGEDCPMLDKITADNFSKFVEAHRLRQAADQIMTELGIEKMGRGFGGQHGLSR